MKYIYTSAHPSTEVLWRQNTHHGLKKLLQIMKMTTFLLLLTFLQVSAEGLSQTVTLSYQNTSIKTILKDIRKQTGYDFIVTKEQLSESYKIDVTLKNAPLKEALETIFRNQPLGYNLLNKTVIVKKELKQKIPFEKVGKLDELLTPPLNISGTVADSLTGEPLSGVTIRVQGTNDGTVTDGNGHFSLETEDDAILEVSIVGYSSKLISINGRSSIDILLASAATGLNQLVVVGYGTQRKKDLTGSVDVVDVKELKEQAGASALEGLQGKAAGVNIISNGAPGASPQIRIRGFSTVNDNDPLYIIDGVPYRGNIGWLNSNDIESMQILKDASAASIYGSRANNGVVIITTKQGHKNSGGPEVSINAYYGFQAPNRGRFPDMLNPQQFAEYLYTRYKNAGETPGTSATTGSNYGTDPNTPTLPDYLLAGNATGQNITEADIDPSKYNFTTNMSEFYQITRANKEGTNWFREITQNAPMENYQINIDGGGENSQYAISGSYLHQDGTIIHTEFKRYTVRSNTSFTFLNDKVTIGENLNYSYSHGTGRAVNEDTPGSYQSDDNIVFEAFRRQSILPVYDIMGNFAGTKGDKLGNAASPVAIAFREKDNYTNRGRLFGSAYVNVEILEDLNFKSNFGLQYETFNTRNIAYPNPETAEPSLTNSLTETSGNMTDWTWSNTLNYDKFFNEKHHLNVLLGIESEKISSRSIEASGRDFFISGDMDYYYIDAAANNDGGSSGAQSSLYSVFGRVDYGFGEKYLTSLTIRRDGSSSFGSKNRFGTFPAASVAWRISQEDFFNVSWVSDLKFRAGYGITGNQNIPPFQYLRRFASSFTNSYYPINGGNNVSGGLWTNAYNNDEVRWEEAKTTNIGVDFEILDHSLDGSFEWFRKITDGMLYPVPRPATITGVGNPPFVNSGKVRNEGVEASLTYHYIRNEFSSNNFVFDIGINISSYRNRIMKLADGVKEQSYQTNRSVTSSIMRAGEAFGSFYGYKVIGIYQNEKELNEEATYSGANVGDLKFEDVSGDGKINSDDRTIIGNPHPDFIYGLNLNAAFKGFDISMAFNGSQGNDIFEQSRFYTDFFGFPGAVSTRVLKAWTPENPNSTIPSPNDHSPTLMQQSSSYYVQDGSYFRMKNLQVGYTFGSLFSENISKLRLYARLANLFLITHYTGMDPEVNQVSSDFSAPGIDIGNYPIPRQFMFGVDITF